MTTSSQVSGTPEHDGSSPAVALGVRGVEIRHSPPKYVPAGQGAAASSADLRERPRTDHNCNHNCNHADSDIVRWYAGRYCHGDVLVARRMVAGWTATEAHRWLRLAQVAEIADNDAAQV